MNDSRNEEIFPDAAPESPGRSTGPRSEQGKANSSMNRLTHGCRSEKTVLPFEDPAEFEFTVQSWTNAYNPQDPTGATLVHETAKAHWFFQRNQKRLDQIESRLPSDAWLWTEEHIKLFNNFLRYRTSAERSFYRAFNNVEAHYKRQADRAAQAEKARVLMAKIQIKWLNKQAEAAAHDQKMIQRVEIVSNNRGDCVTTYTPTNELLASMAHPPQFITRYLCFDFGVPPAYDWLNPDHMQRCERTVGVQQFLFADWLKQIEKEKASGAGHLVPFDTSLILDSQPVHPTPTAIE